MARGVTEEDLQGKNVTIFTPKDLTELVFAIADSLGAPGFVRENGPGVFDDHVPFLALGIPAVDLIDFDYPAWHTTADTPDQCSPESLESVTNVVLHLLHRLGQESLF